MSDHALRGGRFLLIEDEIPQRVEDHSSVVDLHRLQHVRVMAMHHTGAGIDGRVRQPHLPVGRHGYVFVSPVERDYYMICHALGAPDILDNRLAIPGRDPWAGLACHETLGLGD